MKKIYLLIFFVIFIFSGCSKENKEQSGEIKIEQQNNPPSSEKPSEEPKKEVKADELKTDAKQQTQQTQKQEAVSIKANQSSKYIGKHAIVTGFVVDVFRNEKVSYMNFDAKFPKNTFAAVVFKDDFEKFGDLNRFKNKTVEISGVISEYNRKPQIILKNLSQVKIIN